MLVFVLRPSLLTSILWDLHAVIFTQTQFSFRGTQFSFRGRVKRLLYKNYKCYKHQIFNICEWYIKVDSNNNFFLKKWILMCFITKLKSSFIWFYVFRNELCTKCLWSKDSEQSCMDHQNLLEIAQFRLINPNSAWLVMYESQLQLAVYRALKLSNKQTKHNQGAYKWFLLVRGSLGF